MEVRLVVAGVVVAEVRLVVAEVSLVVAGVCDQKKSSDENPPLP